MLAMNNKTHKPTSGPRNIYYKKIIIPYAIPYMKFKSQLLHSHVQLCRLPERVSNEWYDLPCLDTSFSVVDSYCSLMKDTPVSTELRPLPWQLEGSSVVMTPHEAPPSQSPQPYSNDGMDLVSNLKRYDIQTQIILLTLLTRRHSRFGRYLAVASNELLIKCAAVLKVLPVAEACSFLQEVLTKGDKAIEEKVSSLIVAFVMDSARNRNYGVISDLLDVAINNKLNLTGDGVEILDPHATKISACFLLIELILKTKDVKCCLEFVKDQQLIQQLMKIGNITRDDYVTYGQSLCALMTRIYERKKWRCAVELTTFNMDAKVLPPDHNLWGPLALATLLRKGRCGPQQVYEFTNTLILAGIQLPCAFQRATLVYLKRAAFKDANDIFERFSVYKTKDQDVKRKVVVASKTTILIESGWTKEEMKTAIESVWREMEKGSYEDITLALSITQNTCLDEVPVLLETAHAMLVRKYLSQDDDPIRRLRAVVQAFKLEITKNVDILIVFPMV